VLLSTVGLILACKIVLGFLLAVGPIFVGFFLFESTRGLFDGWLRVTLGVALAPLAANVFGVVMLLVLQPFLAALDSNVATQTFDMAPIMTIALIVTVFAGILSATLRVTGGIAAGFASPRSGRERAQTPDANPAVFEGRRPEAAQTLVALEAPRPMEDASVSAARLVTAAAGDGDIPDIRPLSDRLGQRGKRIEQAATRRGSAA
jgi:type IV secretion system protein VirB6